MDEILSIDPLERPALYIAVYQPSTVGLSTRLQRQYHIYMQVKNLPSHGIVRQPGKKKRNEKRFIKTGSDVPGTF